MSVRTIASIVSTVFVLFNLTCGPVPVPPEERPENATVELFQDDECPLITAGMSCRIGVRLQLEKHMSTIRVSSEACRIDSIIIPDDDAVYDTVYISTSFDKAGPCSLFAVVRMKDSEYADVHDTLVVHVYPADAAVAFIKKTETLITHSLRTDTLLFVTGVSGSAYLPVSYSIDADPPIDASQLYPLYSAARDTLKLVVNRAPADTYSVTVVASAKSAKGTDNVTDTARAGVRVFGMALPSVVHAPQTVFTGSDDTLVFTVDHDSAEEFELSLVNADSLDSAIVHVLPTEKDSLAVVVKPVETGVIVLVVGVSNGVVMDTMWYPVAMIDKDSALWNMIKVPVSAQEGQELAIDLKPYCIGDTAGEVLFSVDAGTIGDDTVWRWDVPWGCDAQTEIAVTAQRGDLASRLIFMVDVTPGDDAAPSVRLADTTVNGKSIGSSQFMVHCIVKDSGAGVDKVYILCNGVATEAVVSEDSVYSGAVSGLVHGTPTEITIAAVDRSMKKNSATIQCILTYDSTLQDDQAPVFSAVSGPSSGERVVAAGGEVRYKISDPSGIKKVWWTLNDEKKDDLTLSDEGTVTVSYTLLKYGKSTITVHAEDAAENSNEGTATIVLDYNTRPAAVTPASPRDSASGVDTLPELSWTGGADADGDTVYFRVQYGLAHDALSLSSGEVQSLSLQFGQSGKLTPFTRYFWRVVAYSKAYPDTQVSAIRTFTTRAADGEGPSIEVVAPVDGNRTLLGTGTIAVKASDPQGIDSVYAVVDGTKVVLAESGGTYSGQYILTQYHRRDIVVYAVDKALAHNRSSDTVTVDFNTKPSAVTLSEPADNSTGIDTLVMLQWSCSDADGDSVYYRVQYGYSSDALSMSGPEVGSPEYKFEGDTKLLPSTTYYWRVIGYSKAYPDTQVSPVRRFMTAANSDGPVITILTAPANNSRDTLGTGTISVTVTDPQGVDSVYSVSGGTGGTKFVFTGSGDTYSGQYALMSFGTQTIVITAIDKSSGHNMSTKTITVNYNTRLTPLTALVPRDDSADVAILPHFTWGGATDRDGDSIWYRVNYGTSSGTLDKSSGALLAREYQLTYQLEPKQYYYWQVTAWTKTYPDTVRSAVQMFRTLDTTATDSTGPVITVTGGPADGGRVKNAVNTYTLNVTDRCGVDTVFATLNTGTRVALTSSAANTWTYQCTFVYHSNTVTFEAVDKSVNGNSSKRVVTADYNTPVSAVTGTSPLYGDTVTDTLATFAWTGGTDPDGDAVKYAVEIGTASNSYSIRYTDISAHTYPLTTPLSPSTTYYWRIFASSTAYGDTAASTEMKFRTIANAQQKYHVLYSANGGEGTVPQDATLYTSGTEAEVLGEGGLLSRDHFTFRTWNSSPDGLGSDYAEGDKVTVNGGDVVLYAAWTIKSGELYAHYTFDGADAKDVTGNGHDAVILNAVPCVDHKGVADAAFHFDSAGYIGVSSVTDFSVESKAPRTVCGWFRWTESSDQLYMVLFGMGVAENGYAFQVASAPVSGTAPPFVFRVNGYGDSYDWRTGIYSSNYYDAAWHHAAVTYDGTTTTFYIDGEVKESTSAYVYKLDYRNMGIRIGAELSGGWKFRGDIDDVRFYSKALSAEEVNELFKN